MRDFSLSKVLSMCECSKWKRSAGSRKLSCPPLRPPLLRKPTSPSGRRGGVASQPPPSGGWSGPPSPPWLTPWTTLGPLHQNIKGSPSSVTPTFSQNTNMRDQHRYHNFLLSDVQIVGYGGGCGDVCGIFRSRKYSVCVNVRNGNGARVLAN